MIACSLKEAFTAAMSFIPNQAAKVAIARNGTQTNAAFCSQICAPSLVVCGSPAIAPNTLAVMTSGTTSCMTLTPRLPRPAFRARALPFSFVGKKKEMLDIE